jgi:hypothetical protein
MSEDAQLMRGQVMYCPPDPRPEPPCASMSDREPFHFYANENRDIVLTGAECGTRDARGMDQRCRYMAESMEWINGFSHLYLV